MATAVSENGTFTTLTSIVSAAVIASGNSAAADLDAADVLTARRSAPMAATRFRPTALSCVTHRPALGMNAQSVRKHPTAAPAVLTP